MLRDVPITAVTHLKDRLQNTHLNDYVHTLTSLAALFSVFHYFVFFVIQINHKYIMHTLSTTMGKPRLQEALPRPKEEPQAERRMGDSQLVCS